MNKTPPELDAMVDAVFAYKPKPKSKAAKKRRRKAVRAYPSGHVRSVADQVAAGAVIPRKKS